MSSILKREDFLSPTWKRLTAHLDNRLSELRVQNDRQMDTEQTAAVRGSIAEVKKLLALASNASAGVAITPGELSGDDVSGADA